MAKLTLWGLWTHYKNTGLDLFDALVLPVSDNITAANMKLYTTNAIIARCGEMGVLYPDPALFAQQIAIWSGPHCPVWQRALNALEVEYNPLENYDRVEDWTDADTGTIQRSETGKTSDSIIGGSKEVTKGDPVQTDSVSAYNTSTFAPERKTETTLDSTIDNQVEQSNTGNREDSGTENRNLLNVKHGRAHGNIGVTTSQQMLTQELEISRFASIFEMIAEDFMQQFCIMVY